MLPHPLTNFEIQKYYQNKRRFNGVYLRNNLPKIKDWTWVINLDEYESIETHWISLYVKGGNGEASNNVVYFNSFRVKHIPKEIKKLIGNRNFTTNVFRLQTYNSLMSGYICTGFMLNGKSLIEYTNLFLQWDVKRMTKLYKTFTKIFLINSNKVKMKKICCIVCGKYRKFKNPKISYIFKENSSFFYYL